MTRLTEMFRLREETAASAREKDAEIERLLAAQEAAERTIRAWHKAARKMCDLAISGDCDAIQDFYFDTAMSLPFYGADPDPLPCKISHQQLGEKT